MGNGSESVWRNVLASISLSRFEIRTSTGHWFSTYVDHGSIYISGSSRNAPSCRLPERRRISKSVFCARYPYFERWARGETGIKADSAHMSSDSACIFAIAEHFRNQ